MSDDLYSRADTTLQPLGYDSADLHAIEPESVAAAVAAESGGGHAEAVRHWLLLVRSHPGDAELRWRHAEALRLSGDEAGARQELRKALVNRPDHERAALRLAELQFARGEITDGLTWLKRMMSRRPDDEGLRIAVLGLCAREGMIGHLRVLAERMLDSERPGPRLCTALAFLFVAIGDHPRALEAAMAGLSDPAAPPQLALFAAGIADLAGDPARAGAILTRLAEKVPSGAAYGRRARALSEAGDADGAARAIGSALLMFQNAPEHLADMAHVLSAQRHARLRGTLLAALENAAAEDDRARVALALVYYRLGDWRETEDMLRADPALTDHPLLALARSNIRHASRNLPGGAGRMPEDAFARGLPRPPAAAARDPDRMVLLFDRQGWTRRQRSVMEVARLGVEKEGLTVTILQRAPAGLDRQSREDAAFLAGCLTGFPAYELIDPADLQTGGAAQEIPADLGYLTPAMAAEVTAFRDAIDRHAPGMVHIASAEMAVAGGLAALMAATPRIMMEAGQDWLRDGASEDRAFRAGLGHLAGQRAVRLVASSDESARTLAAALPDMPRDPLIIPPAAGSRDLRRRSGGRERVRAAELLGLASGDDFLSIIGEGPPEGGLSDLLTKIDAAVLPRRTVVWRHAPGPLLSAAEGDGHIMEMRWPIEPAHYLGHARLALAWGAGEAQRLAVLQHAIMGVPVLLLDSPALTDLAAEGAATPIDAPDAARLAGVLSAWLSDNGLRGRAADEAATAVRSRHRVDRALRRFLRWRPVQA